MSDADYIEVLIKAERSEAKPGWKERVFHLENQLEMAKTAAAAKDPNYDPFKDYQTEDRGRSEGSELRSVQRLPNGRLAHFLQVGEFPKSP
jgi:hypothetical protein